MGGRAKGDVFFLRRVYHIPIIPAGAQSARIQYATRPNSTKQSAPWLVLEWRIDPAQLCVGWFVRRGMRSRKQHMGKIPRGGCERLDSLLPLRLSFDGDHSTSFLHILDTYIQYHYQFPEGWSLIIFVQAKKAKRRYIMQHTSCNFLCPKTEKEKDETGSFS